MPIFFSGMFVIISFGVLCRALCKCENMARNIMCEVWYGGHLAVFAMNKHPINTSDMQKIKN